MLIVLVSSNRLAGTIIERHVMVQGTANSYDPLYAEDFEQRRYFAWRAGGTSRTSFVVDRLRPRAYAKRTGCAGLEP